MSAEDWCFSRVGDSLRENVKSCLRKVCLDMFCQFVRYVWHLWASMEYLFQDAKREAQWGENLELYYLLF